MSESRVVLITAMSAEVNQEIAGHAPSGFNTTILANNTPDDQKVEALREAEFLLIHPGDISEQVLRSAKKLKLVQLLRVGYELVDLALLRELGIPFTTTGDAPAARVADHAVMLMLAVYRNLIVRDRSVRDGGFGRLLRGRPAYEMEDKVAGIVGIGNIGKQVARRLRGFGCDIQYFSRHPLTPDLEAELGVCYVSLPELFATSDIVSLHVPITAATRHMLGRDELRTMKPSAIVVNTSRGEVIDETALIEALQQGWIGGAGLDVFDPQPPRADNPLLQMDNVVVTPHNAVATVEHWHRTAQFAWRNVQNMWEGRPPLAQIIHER